LGPRVGLVVLAEKKISCPYLESNLGPCIPGPSKEIMTKLLRNRYVAKRLFNYFKTEKVTHAVTFMSNSSRFSKERRFV
jgi:hypothetical protein